jgi:hypothetical protein
LARLLVPAPFVDIGEPAICLLDRFTANQAVDNSIALKLLDGFVDFEN